MERIVSSGYLDYLQAARDREIAERRVLDEIIKRGVTLLNQT